MNSQKENNIVSFSGGKDSTTMLLMMIEKNIPIHSIVFVDTGWEFPQMYDHIKKVESYIGRKIKILKPKKPFSYWMFEHKVIGRKGENKGKVVRIGYNWPSFYRRWCTREKTRVLVEYAKSIPNSVQYIGYAADEQERAKKSTINNLKIRNKFPLIDWEVTEKQALDYCYTHGFDWSGLYNIFNRVSCFCCPLQSMDSLKKLYKYFPELWKLMLRWEEQMTDNIGFRGYKTVHDLDEEFKNIEI